MPTAQEIFRRLISDPDYVAQNGKTREQVVWEEAKQRERQHRNNQAALSLAWDNSPTLKSFIEYLYKADDEGLTPSENAKPVFYGPLGAIRDAIRMHQAYEEDLPWAGEERIGTLSSLVQPHVKALKTIMSKHSPVLESPESDVYNHRQALNMRVTGNDEESTTGEFDPTVLANLLSEYNGLEHDMRAISNEMNHGRRLLKLGHSPVTRGQEVPSSVQRPNQLRNWFNTANHGGRTIDETQITGRLDLLEQILGYLPAFSDLPEGSEQLSALSNDERQEGMYGNRYIVSNMAENDPNWHNLDPLDEELIQKALENGMVQYDSVQNTEEAKKANNDAISRFLTKTQSQLPQNRTFDHDHVGSPEFSYEQAPNLTEDFNTFMRLTFWNPDEGVGASNLWDILQNTIKRSVSDQPNAGYYTLPVDARRWMDNMHDISKETFINDLLTSSVPIHRLNPDARGNSGINTSLQSYSNIEDEVRDSLIKGKHLSTSFNILQDPMVTGQRSIYRVLYPDKAGNSPLQKLMDSLGTILDTEFFDSDRIKERIAQIFDTDPEFLYKNHFPFASPWLDPDQTNTNYILAGNPLAHAAGESRNFLDILPELDGRREEYVKESQLLRQTIDRIKKHDYEFNREQVPGYGEILDNRLGHLEGLKEEAEALFRPEYDEREAYRKQLRDDISEIQNRETRTIPNPNLEQDTIDANNELRNRASQYLTEMLNRPASEEEIDNLVSNETFRNDQYRITSGLEPEETIEFTPGPLTDEEEAEVSRLKTIIASDAVSEDQDDLSDEVKKAKNKVMDAQRVLNIDLGNVVDPYIEQQEEHFEKIESEYEEDIKTLALPEFKRIRMGDLYQILDYMQTNEVVASEASRQLDIPLNTEEMKYLSGQPVQKGGNAEDIRPLIGTGQASGDVISVMKGEELSQDILTPTLNLSFDSPEEGGNIDQIKAVVNNHPIYQELLPLLAGLNIDVNLLDSSNDPNHGGSARVDFHNPERIRAAFPIIRTSENEPDIDAFAGPLAQDENGEWKYTGQLFEGKLDLFKFLNRVEMDRILSDLQDNEFKDEPQYEYLKNIMQSMEQYEMAPERFVARSQQKFEALRQAQEGEGLKITSLSGLPDDVLQQFETVMHELQNYESKNSKYRYEIPEEMRPIIHEVLPMFEHEDNNHSQEHLDDFLLNFYRQFRHRFIAEYNQITSQGYQLSQLIEGETEGGPKLRREPERDREGTYLAQRGILEEFSERSLLDIIDELLSAEHGTLDEESRVPAPFRIGRTHIPLSVEGVLDEQAIPKIPVAFQFPIDRFRTGGRISTTTDPEYGEEKVPTFWLWLRDHAEYLEAMAEIRNQSLSNLLTPNTGEKKSNVISEDIFDEEGNLKVPGGKVIQGAMQTWLSEFHFVNGLDSTHMENRELEFYRGSRLPDGFIPDDRAMPREGTRSDFYRKAVHQVNKDKEAAMIRPTVESQQIQNLFQIEGATLDERLKNIGKDEDIQQLLTALYGSAEQSFGSELIAEEREIQYDPQTPFALRDEEGRPITQPVLRGKKETQLLESSGLHKEDMLMPNVSVDEEGNKFWDISDERGGSEEGDMRFITRLYARLSKILDEFESEFYDVRLHYDPERGAEGQVQRFTSKQPGESGRRAIYQMPTPEEQDETHSSYRADALDDANAFNTLVNMFQLMGYLEDIHKQNSLPVPVFLYRNPTRYIIEHGNLRATLDNLNDHPLSLAENDPVAMVMDLKEHFPDGYFDNYEKEADISTEGLKTPNNELHPYKLAEDIAIQIQSLQKYLENMSAFDDTKHIIEAYLLDLEGLAEEFNIPNIDDHVNFMLGNKAREFAQENNIVDEDNNFRLFNENGEVDMVTRDFLKPLYTLRNQQIASGKDSQIINLTDRMLRNSGVLEPSTIPTSDIVMEDRVKQIFDVLKEYGQERTKVGEDNPFAKFFTSEGDINTTALMHEFMKGGRIDPQYIRLDPNTGGYKLLMGQASATGEHRPGILGWLHDEWNSYFDNRFPKPDNFGQRRFSGEQIKEEIRSIIERVSQPIDVGDENMETSFNIEFESLLETLKEGNSKNPLEDLKSLLEPEDQSKWRLDMNDLTQVNIALQAGGYADIDKTLAGLHRDDNITDEEVTNITSDTPTELEVPGLSTEPDTPDLEIPGIGQTEETIDTGSEDIPKIPEIEQPDVDTQMGFDIPDIPEENE